MYKTLLRVLGCALWKTSFQGSISAQSFIQILSLAKDQTVLSLVFDVLKNANLDGKIDKKLILKIIKLTERTKIQNSKIDKELLDFSLCCQKTGLMCLVVKGQTIGWLYSNPALRTSGDIDFLVPEISPHLFEVFPNVEFPVIMKEKEYGFKHNGFIYELHTRLIDFGCKKHQILWENLISEEWRKDYYVSINGEMVRTLSPTINAVYLFLHLFFHLIREGVSLRQFCDWAVMLHYYRNEIDRALLNDILKQLDMIRGYKSFGCILVEELGLPTEDFPMSYSNDDRKWKVKILYDIFKGGNFGKHNHKAKSAYGYKIETFRLAARNSIRYYRLAPSEMFMMIPKMIKINLRLLVR